jgi:hypothetical protein
VADRCISASAMGVGCSRELVSGERSRRSVSWPDSQAIRNPPPHFMNRQIRRRLYEDLRRAVPREGPGRRPTHSPGRLAVNSRSASREQEQPSQAFGEGTSDSVNVRHRGNEWYSQTPGADWRFASLGRMRRAVTNNAIPTTSAAADLDIQPITVDAVRQGSKRSGAVS